MQPLHEQINALSRDQAIEAAIFVSNVISDDQPDNDAQEIADTVKAKPFDYLPDIETLARLILLNAAEEDEYSELVKNSIANAGQKAFILGGTEIVMLAFAGVAVVKILKNPMKKKTKKVKKPDGSVEETTEEHDTSPGFLTPIFQSLAKFFK